MPKGGKQPGAGRPLGSLNKSTLRKQAIRERILKAFEAEVEEIVARQVAHAKGVSYMKLRNPDGTFARATDEKQIDAAIAAGAGWFQIFTEVPSVQAFTALADRAIDKPKEHMELTGEDGGPIELTTRLAAGRKRLADRS